MLMSPWPCPCAFPLPLLLFPSILERGPVSQASYEEDTCMLMRGVQKSSGLTQCLSVLLCGAGC